MRRIEYLLFGVAWLGYGCLINTANLTAFGLQQAGIEAYVERHHFYLEGSSVERLKVQPVVDAFVYRGHIYPAKQPGQFMIGACAYFLLHSFGLTYGKNYLLTAGLVTFLTASLAAAASVVAVFKIARHLTGDAETMPWPLTVALTYAFATTLLPYSGIAWHDTLATAYLAIALAVVVAIAHRGMSDLEAHKHAAIAGAFLGLTVTTSIVAAFAAVPIALYFFFVPRWKVMASGLVGVFAGLTPLLIYDFVCFGNPLLLANTAGAYQDTFLRFSWTDFLAKLSFYARMITLYVPIVWIGLVGLLLFPRRLRHDQLCLSAMLVGLAACIMNIDATGTCQYGPRYLLPAMPVAILGLAGFSFVEGRARVLGCSAVACVAAISFAINVLGALQGAMLCDFPHFAAGLYLSQIVHGQTNSYSLARFLLWPLALVLTLLVRQVTAHQFSRSGAAPASVPNR